MRARFVVTLASVALAIAGGCVIGGEADPTDVELGSTAVVVVVNPQVNTANSAVVPGRGADRAGVPVSWGGETAATGAGGVAVLGSLDAGTGPLVVGGGQTSMTVVARELREVAVSTDGGSVQWMADVRYPFGSQEIVEIDAGLSATELEAALNGSNRIVLIRGGTYSGDVNFNGSGVTLFGEGAQGGRVIIDGNVTVNGSQNRIRGALITGNLSVDGSGFALTFSRVGGTLTATGSDLVFLENTVCGTATLPGGNLTVLGNRGLDPIPLAADAGC